MAAAVPAQFTYTYESRMQAERPANNASHVSAATRNDPNFKWQNSGQKGSRDQTVWVRATRRRVTPEYKAFLAAEKARRMAEFDVLAGLMGQMSMAAPTSRATNGYATSLATGMTANQRRAVEAQATQLRSEIDMLTAMMGAAGMEGGKKHRGTRRHRHTKRRHTRRH
jgi:hypothetical protein